MYIYIRLLPKRKATIGYTCKYENKIYLQIHTEHKHIDKITKNHQSLENHTHPLGHKPKTWNAKKKPFNGSQDHKQMGILCKTHVKVIIVLRIKNKQHKSIWTRSVVHQLPTRSSGENCNRIVDFPLILLTTKFLWILQTSIVKIYKNRKTIIIWFFFFNF